MYQLKLLSDFFNAISDDPRISITHIGIYAALLQYWSEHSFENPIRVFSYEIMRLAKISASTTFHKAIRELSDYGYIKYSPSYNRKRGSKIYITHQKAIK